MPAGKAAARKRGRSSGRKEVDDEGKAVVVKQDAKKNMKKKKVEEVKPKIEEDSSEDESSDGEMRDVGDELEGIDEDEDVAKGTSSAGRADRKTLADVVSARAKTKKAAKAGATKPAGAGVDNNDDDDDDDDDDSEADEYEKILMQKGDNAKTLSVEFGFCDPKEDDFAMIKALVTQGTSGLVPNVGLEIGNLAGDITEQAAVGTTICVDDEVYGFASALAYRHYKKQAYFSALKEWILNACPEQRKTLVTEAFEEKGLAWIVSERLVNMPGQLAPPLLRMLCEDIEWARANVKETGGTKDMFDFQYALFLAPCFSGADRAAAEKDLDESSSSEDDDDEEDSDGAPDAKDQDELKAKKAAKGKGPKKSATPAVSSAPPLFLHYEDEDLVKAAEVSFPIKLATKVVLEGKAKGAVPQKHRPRQAQVVLMKLATLTKVVAQLEKDVQ